MSLLTAIWIECDNCGQASTDLLGYATEDLARDAALRHGWTILNLDSAAYDLCPECTNAHQEATQLKPAFTLN